MHICIYDYQQANAILTALDLESSASPPPPHMSWQLADVPWEDASMRHGSIYAVYLGTGDDGVEFDIPNADWLIGELRKTLEDISENWYTIITEHGMGNSSCTVRCL